MATATTKATSLTTLVIGKVEVAVGLFSTVAKSKAITEFTTAGPNGGVLEARALARPVPVDATVEQPDEPVHSDPLADEPSPDFADVLANEDDPPLNREGVAALLAERGEARRQHDDARDEQDAAIAGTEAAKDFTTEDVMAATTVAGEYGRELVEQGTGEVVLPQNVRRGIRHEDGSFVDLTDQLADIDERTKLERIEVLPGGFVDVTQIPRAAVRGCYYIGSANERAPKPLRLLYEGLKAERRAAVVKLTKKSRQSLGAIGWYGKSLMLYELVWQEDFREPPARAAGIQKAEVTEQEVDTVRELIRAWSGPASIIGELRDDAIALREDLLAKALAGDIEGAVVSNVPAVPEPDVLAQIEATLAAVA